jgi:hypothetical protein
MWWRRGELARYRSLITGKLLILNTAVNAKNAVFASPIHVDFTLDVKVLYAEINPHQIRSIRLLRPASTGTRSAAGRKT